MARPPGMGMALLQVSPMRALVLTSIVSGVVSVPLLAALMWAAGSRALLGRFAMRGALPAVGWATTALMAAAAASLLVV